MNKTKEYLNYDFSFVDVNFHLIKPEQAFDEMDKEERPCPSSGYLSVWVHSP